LVAPPPSYPDKHDRSSRLQSGNQLAKNLTEVLF
jgi:hypothetical protein